MSNKNLSCTTGSGAAVPATDEQPRPGRPRVLLLTDRPFNPPVDGSTRIYRAWYDALRSSGADISIISFNRARTCWSAEGLRQIIQDGIEISVFDLYSGPLHAMLDFVALHLYTLLTGSTFRPGWLAAGTANERQRLVDLMRRRHFDVVIIQKIRTLNLLGIGKLISADTLKITDLHDNRAERTHQIRNAARYVRRILPGFHMSSIVLRERLDDLNFASRARLGRYEVRHLGVSDRICVNSHEDLKWLGERGIPSTKLIKLSWPTALSERSAHPTVSTKFDFGFIGTDNLFNIEALLYFGKEIWPLIRAKRPVSTFVVAGRLARLVGRIPRDMFVNTTWLGWVDQVSSFYTAAKIVLIPLRSGTGVSIKTIEAASHGAPIVATSIGIRGLTLVPDRDVLVEDDPMGFASAALSVVQDPLRAARLGAAARSTINVENATERFEAQVSELINISRRQVGHADRPASIRMQAY